MKSVNAEYPLSRRKCTEKSRNFDFLKTPNFGQNTQTALESPKVDKFQNVILSQFHFFRQPMGPP